MKKNLKSVSLTSRGSLTLNLNSNPECVESDHVSSRSWEDSVRKTINCQDRCDERS